MARTSGMPAVRYFYFLAEIAFGPYDKYNFGFWKNPFYFGTRSLSPQFLRRISFILLPYLSLQSNQISMESGHNNCTRTGPALCRGRRLPKVPPI